VPGNPPQAFHLTNQTPPDKVAARMNIKAEPERALKLWGRSYERRASDCGVFLACKSDFMDLWSPPVLRRDDLLAIFGRVPGTQNPPKITPEQFCSMEQFAKTADLNHPPEQNTGSVIIAGSSTDERDNGAVAPLD
jgi:hypothetical protein